MKNIKVRTKLTIILALVIVLVTSESFISIKNMNQLKDKALETMDTSSRQNYDDSILLSTAATTLSTVYSLFVKAPNSTNEPALSQIITIICELFAKNCS